MLKNGKFLWIISVLFSLILFFQAYFVKQYDFVLLILNVLVLFVLYFLVLNKKDISEKQLNFWLPIFYLIPFFALPNLSNDYFRFLWDGELLNSGINPFDYKPNDAVLHSFTEFSSYRKELYAGMGDLSRENYSCYPVFNQFYFVLSTFFSDNILVNVICLRVLIVSTLFVGFNYLKKILKLLQLDSQKAYIFIFNPLLLIEVAQNLHFEGVMLSFFIIAMYFLLKSNYLLGGIFLALAIQIKLIPLILLPFLLRWLNWKNSLITWIVTGFCSILISLLLIYPSNYLHFFESIRLYFRQFEFNSFILHYYIDYGKWRYGYNRIQTFGPYLSRLALELILIFAWYNTHFSFEKMIKRMFFAMLIYYFLSSTVHPWYLLTPILLSVFISYKTVLVWSSLVFLSYYSYSHLDKEWFRTLVGVEYGIVFLFLIYEVLSFRKMKEKARSI